jgi:sortase B
VKNREERDKILAEAKKKSMFSSAVAITGSERMITFSTCSYEYENARFVLIGLLTEVE